MLQKEVNTGGFNQSIFFYVISRWYAMSFKRHYHTKGIYIYMYVYVCLYRYLYICAYICILGLQYILNHKPEITYGQKIYFDVL